MEFKIDPKLKRFMPQTTEAEDRLLEHQILAEGRATKPLDVWSEQNVLIDGHRRFKICREHGLPYTVNRRSFASAKDVVQWVLREQLSRRNLSDHDRNILTARLVEEKAFEKHTMGEAVKEVVLETGQSRASVYRATEYDRAYHSLPEDWQELLRSIKASRRLVKCLSLAPQDVQDELYTMVLEEGVKALAEAFPEPAKPPPPPPESEFPKGTRKKTRVDKLLDEAERTSGAFGRALSKLFGPDGLNSPQSGWKRQLDSLHRKCVLLLAEIRNDQD